MKRAVYLDILRILAVIGVITIHVSANHLVSERIGETNWIVLNIYNKAVNCAVPVFVMISGALILTGDKTDIKKLYKKRILRIVTAYMFWNTFYAFSHCIFMPFLRGTGISGREFWQEIIYGRYHLWYCRMIIGIYILSPLLNSIVRNHNLLKYSLTVCLVFSILLPDLQKLPLMEWIGGLTADMNLDNAVYIFYFMAGYYFSKRELSPKVAVGIFLGGGISQLYIMAGDTLLAMYAGSSGYLLYLEATANVVRTIAIFVFFRRKFSDSGISAKAERMLQCLSGLCFGVYLIHDYFVGSFDTLGLTAVSFNPIIAVPVVVLVVAVICFGLIYCINKVPYIGRFIT